MKVTGVRLVGGIVENKGRYLDRYEWIQEVCYTLTDGREVLTCISSPRKKSDCLKSFIYREKAAVESGARIYSNGLIFQRIALKDRGRSRCEYGRRSTPWLK